MLRRMLNRICAVPPEISTLLVPGSGSAAGVSWARLKNSALIPGWLLEVPVGGGGHVPDELQVSIKTLNSVNMLPQDRDGDLTSVGALLARQPLCMCIAKAFVVLGFFCLVCLFSYWKSTRFSYWNQREVKPTFVNVPSCNSQMTEPFLIVLLRRNQMSELLRAVIY